MIRYNKDGYNMTKHNIKKLRQANHIKQSEMAKLLRVNQSTISQWETNRTEPSIDQIKIMAKLFRCTTDKLLNFSG